MGKRSLRLAFFGTPPFAARCLEGILASRHQVVVVVTQPDRPAGRGLRPKPSAVKELATGRGLPVLQPAKVRDGRLTAELLERSIDVGVVAAYGRILPADVLATAPLGFINAHASLLPELRGAAPIERALLEGYRKTGVTIIAMNERMDAGDILAQREIDIPEDWNRQQLTTALAELAAGLLVETLDRIATGSVTAVPQDESRATYAPPLTKEDARIDWAEPALRVVRRVRAMAPRPGAFTFDAGRRLKILEATALGETTDGAEGTAPSVPPGTVVQASSEGFTVTCGRGVVLVRTVQPEGKRAMAACDYLRGRKGPVPIRFDGSD